MAFIQTAAALGSRPDGALSADNTLPERHIIVDLLRQAAPLLGLKPPVIATLDAMLSCLPPRRSHHTVFASNATLAFRRNGISDRTIRRHVITLQDAGLLARHDSPNGKRFTRRDPATGSALRFGFDLSPLFARLHELAALAAETLREQEQRAYLRCKLRSAAHQALTADPESETALAALRALRRQLSSDALQGLLKAFGPVAPEGPADQPAAPGSAEMSGSDGQNVRHHHKSNKENTDKNPREDDISVTQLIAACPEAAQYSLRKIETSSDVIAHARTLAPMIGIDTATYDAAQARIGPMRSAVTVWAMLQFHARIRRVGAYFRALTSGARSADFDPFALIRRLSANPPCPV